MRLSVLALALAMGAGGIATAQPRQPQGEIEPGMFQLRSLADLVAICRAPATHPHYLEAMGFCHGYGRGALDHFRAVTPRNARPLFCIPQNVSEPKVREDFLAWAEANPARLAGPAVEGIFAFLVSAYPCPPQPPGQPSAQRR